MRQSFYFGFFLLITILPHVALGSIYSLNAQVSGTLQVTGATTLTGAVTFGSPITLGAGQALMLTSVNNAVTSFVGAPTATAASYVLPTGLPSTNGLVLSSDTGGVMSWYDASSLSFDPAVCRSYGPTTGSAACTLTIGGTGAYSGIQTVLIGSQATTGAGDVIDIGTAATAGTGPAITIGSTVGGSLTINSDESHAAGKSISFASGAGNFDMSSSTGTFTTGSGTVSLPSTTINIGKSGSASTIALGQNSGDITTILGSLKFTNTGTLTIATTSSLATQTWTLPTVAANPGQFLSYPASGSTLLWADPTVQNVGTGSCTGGITIGATSGCTINVGGATSPNSDTVNIANNGLTSGSAVTTVAIGNGAITSTGGTAATPNSAINIGPSALTTTTTSGNTAKTVINIGTGTVSVTGPAAANSASVKINIGTGTVTGSGESVVTIGTGSTVGSIALQSDTTIGTTAASDAGIRKLTFTGTSGSVSLKAPTGLSAASTYTLPTGTPGTSGFFLTSTTTGTLSWSSTLPASCPTLGLTTGCTITIGQATSPAADIVNIANSALSATAVTTVAIGNGAITSTGGTVATPSSAITIGPSALTTSTTNGNTASTVINIGTGTVSVTGPAAANSASVKINIGTGTVTGSGQSIVTIGTGSTVGSIALQSDTTIGTTAASDAGIRKLTFTGTSGSVSLKAPTGLSAASTYTLPASTPGTSGFFLTSTTTGTLSWSSTLPASCPTLGLTTGCTITIGQATSPAADIVNIANSALSATAVTTVAIGNGAITSTGGTVATPSSAITIGPSALTTSTTNGNTASTVINIGTGTVSVTGPAAANSASVKINIGTGTVTGSGQSVVTIGTGSTVGSIALQSDTTIGTTAASDAGIRKLTFTGTSGSVSLKAPTGLSAASTYTLPTGTPGTSGFFLTSTTTGTLSWSSTLPASCPTLGVTTGCTIAIGQASGGTNFDTVNIATSGSGANVVSIGNTVTGSSVTLTAGSTNGISLSSNTINAGVSGTATNINLIGTTSTNVLKITVPTTVASQTWTLPTAAATDGQVLSYDFSNSALKWVTAGGANTCASIGTATGCTMSIGQGSTGSDAISIASSSQPSPVVNIATTATTGATVTIGTSGGTSKVSIAAGSQGISLTASSGGITLTGNTITLAGSTTITYGKSLSFNDNSGTPVPISFTAPATVTTGSSYTLPAAPPTVNGLVLQATTGTPNTLSWEPTVAYKISTTFTGTAVASLSNTASNAGCITSTPTWSLPFASSNYATCTLEVRGSVQLSSISGTSGGNAVTHTVPVNYWLYSGGGTCNAGTDPSSGIAATDSYTTSFYTSDTGTNAQNQLFAITTPIGSGMSANTAYTFAIKIKGAVISSNNVASSATLTVSSVSVTCFRNSGFN